MLTRFRRYFIAGLAAFLPLALTIYLLIFTFNFADGILGKYLAPYFRREFGFYVRGISLFLCLFLILFIGFFATNFVGQRFFPFLEKFLLRLPFFKQVYPAIKEIAIFLFSRERLSFRQVVLIEYPRAGIYSIGFLTNTAHEKIAEKLSKDMCYVFIPHTPSPLTGFLTLVSKKDLLFPDITVEDAIKIIISGGVIRLD